MSPRLCTGTAMRRWFSHVPFWEISLCVNVRTLPTSENHTRPNAFSCSWNHRYPSGYSPLLSG